MRIGVLASQGAFAEHIAILHQLEVEAMPGLDIKQLKPEELLASRGW